MMKDFFEQSTKRMEETWGLWQRMVSELPWMDQSDSNFLRWKEWFPTMRLTFDMNMRAWKTFMEQNETTFFRMLKEAPFHNEMSESQFRASWDAMKKACESYNEMVDTQFQKMEEMLKKEA